MECIFCAGNLYTLSDGRVKCSKCKRRYSQKRVNILKELATYFCDGLTAKEASQKCGVSYPTASGYYKEFRELIALFLENEYAKNRENIKEYDEYLYLDHSKRRDRRKIFDAHNFLTFDYGGKVYNILMPSLHRYKHSFLDDGLEDLYYSEFSRFMKIHRIAKLASLDNTIVSFWKYFDEFMKKFKGVDSESFFSYLKEAEFKFNYPESQECLNILWRLYLESKSM